MSNGSTSCTLSCILLINIPMKRVSISVTALLLTIMLYFRSIMVVFCAFIFTKLF